MEIPSSNDTSVALALHRLQAAQRRQMIKSWSMAAVLFGATVVSTLYVGGGGIFGTAAPQAFSHVLRDGLPFAGTLLAILLCHEFGHYFTAMAHGVTASPPYFIPFPSLTGTLGAVIRMRGTMPSRRALVDIGASGPIAGFLVAVPMLFVGLARSHLEPSLHAPMFFSPESPLTWLLRWVHGQDVFGGASLGVLQEGSSLVLIGAERIVFGRIPPGMDVALSPVAFAAWFGLLVTALNLLPIGQLDGGHVLYAVLGDRARTVGRILIGVLVMLWITSWMGWLLWALLSWKVIKTTHPPVEDSALPLGRARTFVAWTSLALLLLTFMPAPLMVL